MENKLSRKKNPPTQKEIELANRLRLKRIESNLSLQEVAEKIGVSKVTISRYETLDITNIPSDKIEGMAKLYGVSPAYLMGWTEDKKEEKQNDEYDDEEFKLAARDYKELPEDKKQLFNAMMKSFIKTLKENK